MKNESPCGRESDRVRAEVRRVGSDRRGFLATALGTGLAAAGIGAAHANGAKLPRLRDVAASVPRGSLRGRQRAQEALQLRMEVARRQYAYLLPTQSSNGDEDRFPGRIASYTKALPHNALGEVDLGAYRMLTRAIRTGNHKDFDRIPAGGIRPQTNPQGGLAFSLEGADPQHLSMPPAPAFSSAEEAAEIAENYWMALARDVPFADYNHNPITVAAAAELSRLPGYTGPRAGGKVTPQSLFRTGARGVLDGPFISQFLVKDTPYGAERVSRKIRTAVRGVDYMTTYQDWIASQNGHASPAQRFDRTHRYVRNGRDIGEWVHNDVLFQAYFNALLILVDANAPLDAMHPYVDVAVYRGRIAGRYWRNQIGFATFGAPYVASLVCAVAKQALATVWFQKWFVHKRLRPEVFAGRIHNHMTGKAEYPIHNDILKSSVLHQIHQNNGTYLLPQAFPEGSPTHPSYGAGHATVAGACVTVLKAFLDESFVLPKPVESTPSGLAVSSYGGPYHNEDLTVGGELNKLAMNIAVGRNFAGVHWRSDAVKSLELGEEVAIRVLADEHRTFDEHFAGFSLTRFDGRRVVV